MTVPIIGGIEAETWEYRSNLWNRLHSGIFEWGLLYKETQITEKEQKNRHRDSMPFRLVFFPFYKVLEVFGSRSGLL